MSDEIIPEKKDHLTNKNLVPMPLLLITLIVTFIIFSIAIVAIVLHYEKAISELSNPQNIEMPVIYDLERTQNDDSISIIDDSVDVIEDTIIE